MLTQGCTMQKKQMPIFVESLINSFKLRRTTQEMRRHGGYLVHAKPAEYESIQRHNYNQIARVGGWFC